MFTKLEKMVLNLILGHQALLKQRLDQVCNSLTLVKTDVEEPKKALASPKRVYTRNFQT